MTNSNSNGSVTKVIEKFLEINVNRAFSANELIDKFGKDFGKSNVQRSLEGFVSKGKVVEKQFGKQKIYFVKQTEDNDDVKTEIENVKKNLLSLEYNLKSKEDNACKFEAKLKEISSGPSLQDLEIERNALQMQISELEEDLERILSQQQQSPSVKISPDEAKEIDKRYDKFLSIYRKRKRICTDMLDGILEGYPKTKKHLIDEIGIETDEITDFKL